MALRGPWPPALCAPGGPALQERGRGAHEVSSFRKAREHFSASPVAGLAQASDGGARGAVSTVRVALKFRRGFPDARCLWVPSALGQG